MLTITINDVQVRQLLGDLYDHTQDFSPAMKNIGQELDARVRARFETETDPLGHHWTTWAKSTRKHYPFPGTVYAKKAGKAGNGRILDRYGEMLKSLSWESDATSARVGFGERYAVYHEYGTKRMPRRGMLFADPETKTLAPGDMKYVLDVIQRYLMQQP